MGRGGGVVVCVRERLREREAMKEGRRTTATRKRKRQSEHL